MSTLNQRSEMPVSADELSAWHFREGALTRLIPPWENARVIRTSGPLANGSLVVIELRKGPVKIHWYAIHDRVEPGKGFRDTQQKGPFHKWVHEHRFQQLESGKSTLEDCVNYQEPFPPLGRWFGAGFIRGELNRQFQFRHARTFNDLRRGAERPSRSTKTVAISGATGMVGRQLAGFLSCAGDSVRRIVRTTKGARDGDILWNQTSGEFDLAKLEGCDAVVHLAGENIAGGRWTEQRKKLILSSRVDGTRQLCQALARLKNKPKVLICASGVGFYGAGDDKQFDETSALGKGFLAQICKEWESATQAASDAGIRVVNMRIGIVISAQGGVLAKLLTPFLLGAGGPIAGGRQGMSWIALDDLLAAITFAIDNENISGALNATAPAPLSNRDFGRVLARVLHRPFLAPLPAFVVRAIFGEMGQELLLQGAFVQPKKLLEHGFRFDFPKLESVLRFELGRMKNNSTSTTEK
ncbi:MAG: TIGR01777 family oxidoreductase [Phycisphaerae bacterium]